MSTHNICFFVQNKKNNKKKQKKKQNNNKKQNKKKTKKKTKKLFILMRMMIWYFKSLAIKVFVILKGYRGDNERFCVKKSSTVMSWKPPLVRFEPRTSWTGQQRKLSGHAAASFILTALLSSYINRTCSPYNVRNEERFGYLAHWDRFMQIEGY